MKKIISMLLVSILVLSTCASAFAGTDGSITVSVGSGTGTVSGAGTGLDYPDDGSKDYPITATPASGYEFEKWILDTGVEYGKGFESLPITLKKDKPNRSATAYFKAVTPEFEIKTIASPAEGGIVTGGGKYPKDTSVTLTAIENEGYRFVKWSNDTTEKTRTIIADSEHIYTAYFEKINITIKAASDPVEGGTVSYPTELTHEYSKTEYASFTATEKEGYEFVGWYYGATLLTTSKTVTTTFDENRILTAKFTKKTSTDPATDPPTVDPKPDPVKPDPDPVPDPLYPYKEFKITYHPGAYGAEPAVQDIAVPGSGWLRGSTFTREGYVQAGWSWDPYGKEFNAALYAPMPMLYENITVYPYWEPIKGPLTLTVGYSGSGAIQVNGRYVYNGEGFTVRPGESLTFGFYPASGNYVYSVLLAGRYREYPGNGLTVTYDMMQNRSQTLAVRFESVYTRPKTGDDSNIGLWIALGICSAVCLGVLVVAKKKKK